MTEQITVVDYASDNVLSFIHDGMSVFDADGKKVGKVKQVTFGDRYAAVPAEKPADTFNLPVAFQVQMARDGYVVIHSSFLSRRGIITADQIDSVSDESITLNVPGKMLFKI